MRLLYIAIISVFTTIQPLLAQGFTKEVDVFLNRNQELKRFSGMVLVSQNGKILLNKGYGFADYENRLPFTSSTRFNIAGLTEQFTAYITLKLVEANTLSLHQPINAYLADDSLTHSTALTLHHLLSHTSGLPDFPWIHELPQKQFFAKNEIISYVNKQDLTNGSDTEYNPSKLNYNLIGLVLEKVTQKSYAQLLREHITEPIGMNSTSLDDYYSVEPHRAKGYIKRTYSRGWENAPFLDPANSFAASGILSTTEDLFRWSQYVMKNYPTDQALKAMLTSYSKGMGYGLKGLLNGEIQGVEAYNNGYNAYSTIDLTNQLIIIVLSNNRNPSYKYIAEGVKSILLKHDYTLPLSRQVVNVDAKVLQEYVGEYRVNDQFVVKIMADNAKLFLETSMHPRMEVFPQSSSQFFIADVDVEIRFIRNKENQVTTIVLQEDGYTSFHADKIIK